MPKQQDTIEEQSRFVASVQAGLKQLDSGKRIPHEDIEREVEAWLDEWESSGGNSFLKLAAEKS